MASRRGRGSNENFRSSLGRGDTAAPDTDLPVCTDVCLPISRLVGTIDDLRPLTPIAGSDMDCRRDARLTGFGGSADFFGANSGCLPSVGAMGTFSDAYKEKQTNTIHKGNDHFAKVTPSKFYLGKM